MHVYFARDGKLLGLYPDDGVTQLLDGHAIVASDYFWHEGMPEWKPIASRWEMPPNSLRKLAATAEQQVRR